MRNWISKSSHFSSSWHCFVSMYAKNRSVLFLRSSDALIFHRDSSILFSKLLTTSLLSFTDTSILSSLPATSFLMALICTSISTAIFLLVHPLRFESAVKELLHNMAISEVAKPEVRVLIGFILNMHSSYGSVYGFLMCLVI